jgi:hypothetical protein
MEVPLSCLLDSDTLVCIPRPPARPHARPHARTHALCTRFARASKAISEEQARQLSFDLDTR